MDEQDNSTVPDQVAAAITTPTTEPLRLVVDVDGEFGAFGIYDLYEEATDTLTERVEHASEELIRGATSPAAQARLADIAAVLTEWGPFIQSHARHAQAAHLREEWVSIVQAAADRAEKAGDPLYFTLAAAGAAELKLSVLWEQDRRQYRQAYADAVRQYLDEQQIDVGVEVIDMHSDQANAVQDESHHWSPAVAQMVDQLHTHARTTAALPMTGEAPDWSDGTPADALRRTGLTYLERATAP